MNPTTTVDPRYSDPKAVAVGWDETRTLLEAAELFWICTVRPDGRPGAQMGRAVATHGRRRRLPPHRQERRP